MQDLINYLSLFSGIEACTSAWEPLGWTCKGVSEIEPFPCAALKHHYPQIPNLGDVTKITDEKIKALGRIDVVVGGSPCQDLSVAGKRAGLEGARSSLFHHQLRIFNAARTFCGARFLLWENVPGSFSSKSGRDFAVVVGEMAGAEFTPPKQGWQNSGVAIGKNGLVEWCVLDAQYAGLAQRRKRVFVILDTGNWTYRSPILLESESMHGDTPPRRETGQGITHDVAPSAGESGEIRGQAPVVTGFRMVAFGEYAEDDTASAMKQRDYKDATDLVAAAMPITKGHSHAVAVSLRGRDGGGTAELGDEVGNCLRASSGGGDKPHVLTSMQVRRLTPIECERLQGFPDNHTQIAWRGKPAEQCPDGPRYKALGNSMAVPCMHWIGKQIQSAFEKDNKNGL